MNENQNNVQYYEDEIDLRELIMALWKRKIMIICFTLIAAILAGMFSMFVLSPVYDSKLNIVISMPEKYITRYGEYVLPITTNEQYINLITSNDVLLHTIEDMGYDKETTSIDGLRKKITVGKNEAKAGSVQNSFEVIVSANNPEEALKLAQILYSNYLDFLDSMTKERAVNYYYNHFTIELRALENSLLSQKEILKSNEDLLAQTPKNISDGNANIEIQSPLNGSSDYILPVDTINPNYIKLETDIIANKQLINNLENSIRMNNQYLAELDREREAIYKYYRTGQTEILESSVIGVVETNVYLPSPPVAPTQKTSPSNALNTAIGAVLGGMLGVMVALFQEYWFKKA
ncbi:Wzz/FepE/Etk N-terminal domain-containing protein [Sedimentibacter sp.]|uniref:Wzz/FepE/Etk N-terminal domain-containing protein n=1 Tax=Sedimentibacter sp. TaxID=1960295 RepID=UPI00289BFFC9|nr:Wzz/FepE/Etk N-terminal domain-containing protein [Sedimentibacter sp.]